MFFRLTAITALQILALAGALVYYLLRIVNSLEKIGGFPNSDLARTRYGVRAIETETSHLAPQVTQLNEGLLALAGKLVVVDGQLAAVANKLGGGSGSEVKETTK
ncbi:MAG: hypothetical protein JWP00_3863 [Chloroflexi bacterium]|nr:hypothetical protein [Chloroflexota bacterium]